MQVDEKVLSRTIERFRERKVLLPTFAQMRDPSTVPEKIKQRLKNVGLWDVDPVNLFRITWKNEPVERGGLYNKGNWIEFPSALTGVDAILQRNRCRFAPDQRTDLLGGRLDIPELHAEQHQIDGADCGGVVRRLDRAARPSRHGRPPLAGRWCAWP